PERLNLIYRGVDLARYPFEPGAGAAEKREKFIAVNIGRLTPIKGHPHFIRSICLAAMHIPGLEAWIVGDCEEGREGYRAELDRLVARFGLQGRICFLGRRNDIPEILRKADVLALTTSVQEGFGRVLIEAGARGTPVVSTRVGGVTEIIEHEKDGILVPSGDDEALARAFVDLWQHPEKRANYAKSFRQKIENHFSLEILAEKTVRVYEKALSRKKILVLKLGSLGDLILAVPSFRALKKKFPDSEVTLAVDSRWYPVAKTIPYLDRIITYERHARNRWRRLLRLARRLRKEGFDFSLDLQNNSQTHLLAFLAGISRRYGYRRKWTGSLLTHSVAFESQGISPVRHQFRLLQLLGITEADDRLELWPEEEAEKKTGALLAEHWVSPGQRLIGFSLSASSKWPTKNWPAERFLELAGKVNERFNARVILFGGREASRAGALFEREKLPFVINLIGRTPVGEWISLIRRLDLLVTADSAPMHVAAACGTKFVALFGPTDPRRHLPPAKNFAVIQKKLSCVPCYSGRCKVKEFLCMPSIECEEVFQRIEQLLATEKEPLKI
ncbi:MAG TPA: lipopolysaccharide heptosyltransferase II, partial [Candidatus Omnitrophota bacterium]|nr:lipopolysaccharide heptosyltransferase II [Candidatus Omnitrophota bacterium]